MLTCVLAGPCLHVFGAAADFGIFTNAVSGVTNAGQVMPPAAGQIPATEAQQGNPQQPDNTGVSSQNTDVNESPYQSIIKRNAFGLKPPPPPAPAPEPTPQVTPSALKLTGITTLGGGKRAMFVLQEPNKPQLISDLVREGERDSIITNLEVLSIDERAGVVRVKYGGKELALNFQDHGLKAPVAAPQQAGRPIPGQPGATVASTQPPTAAGTSGALARVQSSQASTVSSANVQSPSTLQRIPTRPARLTPSGGTWVSQNPSPGQDTQITQPEISPEQQVQSMRAQHDALRRYGIPAPPLPPLPGETSPPESADVVVQQPAPFGTGPVLPPPPGPR